MKKYLFSIAFALCSLVSFAQANVGITLDWWTSGEVAEAPPPEDIDFAWLNEFNIESGESVSATWNTDVNPSLINLGTNTTDWTTVDASKPTLTNGALVFNEAHRVAGTSMTFPPLTEIWIVVDFDAANGAAIGWGSQSLFGVNSGGQWFVRDLQFGVQDYNEHVVRIVLNGATSIFQVDGGTPQAFDENFTSASTLALGQTFSGANQCACKIKLLQMSPNNTFLTTQQVEQKWTYHGF